MALDNANFVAELSITDPPGTDPLSQGDDQIRTIKRATFQSFPFIDKQVDLTADQMNEAAIKNENNVFTDNQVIQNAAMSFNDTLGTLLLGVSFDTASANDWALINDKVLDQFRFRRFALGAPVDDPWNCDLTTGVIDFAQVPTVQGAPLWIAGELRLFAISATLGTNWFLADGTNGTGNFTDRALIASGASNPGDGLTANLVGTAAAGTTGSTAISAAQMASHRHRIRSGGASGITDVALGNVSTQTVVGANRGNTSSQFFDANSGGQQFIENTGSGSGHTHTSPAQAVTETGTGRDIVRPFSRVVQMFQYVP